ncbi:MAG: alcohol dehydrogenase catalytic domain-containing protein [Fimbriimonadaceae bacterium]|nr:alcohol dehydrogenase catalytic domain-containing protein [Fimbriimonadaceae bacterium]
MTIPADNRLARYVGGGRVEIVTEPTPTLPPGGLIVRTEACGLCSGELMAWYMDRKLPHVLGHEVAGIVVASDCTAFPTGTRVFPHHHAPCLRCDHCARRQYVQCPQWKSTRLQPGGMAEYFAVAAENLSDCHAVDDLHPADAALIEPLACVAKAIRLAPPGADCLVIGLGFMGQLFMHVLPGAVGIDLHPDRVEHAVRNGHHARTEAPEPDAFDTVYVCPGSQAAFHAALTAVRPGGTIAMFAPLAPDTALEIPQLAYFKEVNVVQCYSAGPPDCVQALRWLRAGIVSARNVVTHQIALDELPDAYVAMRDMRILKPMVIFGDATDRLSDNRASRGAA